MRCTVQERPILFNGEMVRAILAARKTQTRRPCKPQPTAGFEPWFGCEDGYQFWIAHTCPPQLKTKAPDRTDHHGNYVTRCPFGRPGDRLWVREAYCPDWADKLVYRADDPTGRGAREAGYAAEPKYRPSIHMPRWASRVTLEIGEIRVERLHDMTNSDARSEGIFDDGDLVGPTARRLYGYASEFGWRQPKRAFAHMWNVTYAKRGLGWDANPWVWVISFRPLEANS